jgi:PAS domain S-box-containing protein
MIRDVLLGIFCIYSVICIIIDLRKNKNYKFLLFPVAGIFFALAGAAVDIGYVYTGVNYDLFPNEFYSRFSLGITLFIIYLLSGLTSQFIDFAREVERAHRLIIISEEKLRVLVEGTSDLIFTIDPSGRIYSANKAALRETGIDEKKLGSLLFSDLLHLDSRLNEVEKHFFYERLSDLNENKKPLNLKIMLRDLIGEPKEYQIRMEYINIEGRNEIIVRAVSITENTLIRYLDSESQKYVIGNFFIAAEEISKRLVANLAKYIDSHQVMQIRLGLREVIINAIEHGNLNLTFEEKSEATMNDSYMEVIAARRIHPQYRDKKVTIKFSLNPERVIYIIEDQGDGFNYKSILERVNDDVNAKTLAHGRGITLALSIFDSVNYNKQGNRVTLIRKFLAENDSVSA